MDAVKCLVIVEGYEDKGPLSVVAPFPDRELHIPEMLTYMAEWAVRDTLGISSRDPTPSYTIESHEDVDWDVFMAQLGEA